jgi:hypothetical protein
MRKLLGLFGVSTVFVVVLATAMRAEAGGGTTQCTGILAPGTY